MKRVLGALASGALALVWVSRPDALALDLARHHETVVAPLVAAERHILDTLEPLAGDPAALARACEASVLPLHRERLRAAEEYRPRTQPVRALDDVLVEECRGATTVLERWTSHQIAKDPDAARSAADALAALEMNRAREAVERTYERHAFKPPQRPLDR